MKAVRELRRAYRRQNLIVSTGIFGKVSHHQPTKPAADEEHKYRTVTTQTAIAIKQQKQIKQ